MTDLDTKDRAILAQLQQDAAQSNQTLAKAVGLSPAQCWRRVKRLQDIGVIVGQVVLVDPNALGLTVLAYAHVSLEDHHPNTIAALDRLLSSSDEVLECMALSGEYDYLLKIRTHSLEAYWDFIRRGLLVNPSVRSVNTNFVMSQRKATTALPLA